MWFYFCGEIESKNTKNNQLIRIEKKRKKKRKDDHKEGLKMQPSMCSWTCSPDGRTASSSMDQDAWIMYLNAAKPAPPCLKKDSMVSHPVLCCTCKRDKGPALITCDQHPCRNGNTNHAFSVMAVTVPLESHPLACYHGIFIFKSLACEHVVVVYGCSPECNPYPRDSDWVDVSTSGCARLNAQYKKHLHIPNPIQTKSWIWSKNICASDVHRTRSLIIGCLSARESVRTKPYIYIRA